MIAEKLTQLSALDAATHASDPEMQGLLREFDSLSKQLSSKLGQQAQAISVSAKNCQASIEQLRRKRKMPSSAQELDAEIPIREENEEIKGEVKDEKPKESQIFESVVENFPQKEPPFQKIGSLIEVAGDLAYPQARNPIIRDIILNCKSFQEYPVSSSPEEPRTQLPVLISQDKLKFNAWAIARRFIGMDITRVSLPVTIAEPLSNLQRCAQIAENIDSYEKANATEDPGLRVAYCLAGILIDYARVVTRTRKPFNPMLGETFELEQGDLRVAVEQVSHHPPISAFHIESPGCELTGSEEYKVGIGLRGINIKFTSPRVLILKRTGEKISFKIPNPKIHNLIFGKHFVWYDEPMVAISSTGYTAEIKYFPPSKNPEENYRIAGTVTGPKGNILYNLRGFWHKEVSIAKEDSREWKVLARVPDPMPNWELQHFFTPFCVTLNQLTCDQLARLPQTDSRFRSDLRAFDFANVDLAETEKFRLEERQRAIRKQMEKHGVQWRPLWFDPVTNHPDGLKFVFNRKYWKTRETQNWPSETPDLFSSIPVKLYID